MTKQTALDPYRGRDPRQIPAYTIFDASRYLQIPERTIRNWAYGYRYATQAGGRRHTAPLIEIESSADHDLSFFNLIELHVLSALRREHQVQMPKIRSAVDYLKKELRSARPLIDEEMETDGTNIFVTKLGSLINVSQNGQLAMKALLQAHLMRIERDSEGLAKRLFPFTRRRAELKDADRIAHAPRIVAMDPSIAFGRPVIAGSRVPTIEIFERFNAGESPEDLAADFGRRLDEIHEAIRCETSAAA